MPLKTIAICLSLMALVRGQACAIAGGVQQRQHIRKERPPLPLILVSGKSHGVISLLPPEGMAHTAAPFISMKMKPMSLPEKRENFLLSVYYRDEDKTLMHVGTVAYFSPPRIGKIREFFISIPQTLQKTWREERQIIHFVVKLEGVSAEGARHSVFQIVDFRILTK